MARKAIDREARRKYIIAAARRVFEQKGIENTSMDDIAEAAQYTRRTLYSYFNGRDEIGLLVLIEDMTARWQEQKTALEKADTGFGKIRVWAESLYSFVRRNPHSLHTQMYWDFRGIDRRTIGRKTFAALEAINYELAEGLRKIFRLGIRDGSLRPDLKVDMTISHFLYSLRSIVHRGLSSTYSFASFDSDEYVKNYLELFFLGIENRKGNRNAKK